MWRGYVLFHKMWGISWVDQNLLASQEGLCSTELFKHLVSSAVSFLSNEQHQTELYVKPICQPKNSHTHKRPPSKRDTGKAGRVDPLTHRVTIQVNNRNNEVNVLRTAGSPTHTDTDSSTRVSVTVSCSIDNARVVELLTTDSYSFLFYRQCQSCWTANDRLLQFPVLSTMPELLNC